LKKDKGELKINEKDEKTEEELAAERIFSSHEFFIPDGLGCSVELELHEYYSGDPMNEETRKSAENVRITFLSDLGELDLQMSIPKSVFQRLLSLGSKFSHPALDETKA
jgi:hypothetical protein